MASKLFLGRTNLNEFVQRRPNPENKFHLSEEYMTRRQGEELWLQSQEVVKYSSRSKPTHPEDD
jgi:hypothetical protein